MKKNIRLTVFYCRSALAKLKYSEAVLEAKLKEKGISEYTKRSKQYKLGYFFAYGTSFAFFLLIPNYNTELMTVYNLSKLKLNYHKWHYTERILHLINDEDTVACMAEANLRQVDAFL